LDVDVKVSVTGATSTWRGIMLGFEQNFALEEAISLDDVIGFHACCGASMRVTIRMPRTI
jgi:hypothetical protein